MNWLLSKGLGFAGKKLDGYKTKIGGVGLIIFGLIGAINIMFPESVPGVDLTIEQVMGNITGGLVAIGIGGKLDKNTEAVKEQTNVVQGSEQKNTSPAENAISIDAV